VSLVDVLKTDHSGRVKTIGKNTARI